MRPMPNKRIEKFRQNVPGLTLPAEEQAHSPMGVFQFSRPGGVTLRAICGVAFGWEHVSVVAHDHNPNGGDPIQRTPSWEEMCWIKRQFWGSEEVVIQYHPTEENYVNIHKHCLHLWKPLDQELPSPPKELVG